MTRVEKCMFFANQKLNILLPQNTSPEHCPVGLPLPQNTVPWGSPLGCINDLGHGLAIWLGAGAGGGALARMSRKVAYEAEVTQITRANACAIRSHFGSEAQSSAVLSRASGRECPKRRKWPRLPHPRVGCTHVHVRGRRVRRDP